MTEEELFGKEESFGKEEPFGKFFQKHNTIFGILICSILTSILYLVYPFGIFFVADVYLIIGCCVSLYITFKYKQEFQSPIKLGIIVGIAGSIISLVFIGLYDWLVYSLRYYVYLHILSFDVVLLFQYLLYILAGLGIIYIIVGIVIGYLFGARAKKKELDDSESPLLKV